MSEDYITEREVRMRCEQVRNMALIKAAQIASTTADELRLHGLQKEAEGAACAALHINMAVGDLKETVQGELSP